MLTFAAGRQCPRFFLTEKTYRDIALPKSALAKSVPVGFACVLQDLVHVRSRNRLRRAGRWTRCAK